MDGLGVAAGLAGSSNGAATKIDHTVKKTVKRINAIMMTCGLYNSVGDFAYRVGIPAKSGVSGAIGGVIPGYLSLAVWSPGLDENGNSLAGIKAMELFTTKTGVSIIIMYYNYIY